VAGFVIYKKGCTRRAAASDKVYQLLAHGRWFSTGSLVSSTIKTGRHDIAEILLKVALKHQKSNQIKSMIIYSVLDHGQLIVGVPQHKKMFIARQAGFLFNFFFFHFFSRIIHVCS
jgi:hypothetical protein